VKRVLEGTSCTTTDDDWVRAVVPFYEKAARMEAAEAAEAEKNPFMLCETLFTEILLNHVHVFLY
jgi:hypothetical protein